MSTLYRPVLIESAEQAEALPIGMVLIREGHYAYQKGDGAPGSDYVDGGPETAIGWTALVPIEAEAHTVERLRACDIHPTTLTRYATGYIEETP